MPKKATRPRAAKKSVGVLSRRALFALEVANVEDEDYYQVDDAFRRAKGSVNELLPILQNSMRLPRLDFTFSRVRAANPTPATVIDAYESDRSVVRVSVHVGRVDDDTTDALLGRTGISHLLGICVDLGNRERRAVWEVSETGRMLAIAKIPKSILSDVLEDVVLDMLFAHALNQPWSEIRASMSAAEFAAQKVAYIVDRKLQADFPFGQISNALYVPLSSIARKNVGSLEARSDRLLDAWVDFANHMQRKRVQPYRASDVVSEIIKHHVNGGQISRAELQKEIEQLPCGRYDLYFLTRRPRSMETVKRVKTLFELTEAPIRTQSWIVLPYERRSRLAEMLTIHGYATRYPFCVMG